MDVLNFLLPSASLDWVFASLLLSWLIFSLFAAFKAKKSIDFHVTASHFKNIKSSVNDLSAASRHPFWDHIVDNAPGFALVIGLLGTFLGIGMAIQGAGGILADLNSGQSSATDIRQTVGQLSPMLSEIGLKFKSSAWGIIIHIILRFTIPLFGIEEKRLNEIFKELEKDHTEEESLNSNRWDIIKQLEENMKDSLLERKSQHVMLVECLDNQNKSLAEMIGIYRSIAKIQDLQLKELNETNDAQKRIFIFLEKNILPAVENIEMRIFSAINMQDVFSKKIMDHMDFHKDRLEKYIDFQDLLIKIQKTSLESIAEIKNDQKKILAIDEKIIKSQDLLIKIQQTSLDGVSEIKSDQKKILAIDERVIKSQDLLVKIQQTSLDGVSEIKSDQKKILSFSEENILPSLKKSENSLLTIASVQADFGSHVTNLGRSVDDFQETVGMFKSDMHDSLHAMQHNTKQASDGLQKAITTMKDQVDSTFTDFRQGVSSTLAKVGQDIAGSSDAIKESVYTLSDGVMYKLDVFSVQ